MTTTPYRTSAQLVTEPNVGYFAGKVYAWMTGMLLATAATSFVAIQAGLHNWFRRNPGYFLVCFFSRFFWLVCLLGFVNVFLFQKDLAL